MCDRCADIDYKVADCWRPCYTPSWKRRSPGYIPTILRGGFSDEDFSHQQKINDLLATIKRQREEISTLKARQQPPDSRGSFEGIE